jgi:hypothetical protein
MRYRRRAERMRRDPSGAAQRRTRGQRERRQQRVIYSVALAGAIFLIAFLLIGYFFTIHKPPRKVVAEVGSSAISLEMVAKQMRLYQGLGIDASPQQSLNVLIRNEILRQRGSLDFAAVITEQEIERYLAGEFEVILEGEIDPPELLTSDGHERYSEFLKLSGIEEEVTRAYIEGELMMEKIRNFTRADLPSPQDQVYLHWMIASTEENGVELVDRLNAGEEFGSIAKELENSPPLADIEGAVGWTPRGVLPEFGDVIFGAEHESILGPLDTVYGQIVAKISKGPEPQPLSDQMRDLLSSGEVSFWIQTQMGILLGNYEFGDEEIRWVAKEVQIG